MEDRICPRCGQPVNPQKDSWRGTATGIEHTSCPTSPEMKQIPTVAEFRGESQAPNLQAQPPNLQAQPPNLQAQPPNLQAQPPNLQAQPPNLQAQPPNLQAQPPNLQAQRPQYLTMQQAAKMLSVSDKTIQRRIRSGELPAKRLRGTSEGGRQTILIDQADVLALLEDYDGKEAAA